MLPLIAGFVVSLAGSFIGKAIASAFETSKAQTAKTASPDASGPFASLLAQETQRFAQAPGPTATDARPVGPGALPAAPHFGGALRSLDEFQAP